MAKRTKEVTQVRIKRKKTTTIGASTFTRFRSKNDRRNKKRYRGQGR